MGEPSYWVLCANCGTVLLEEKMSALVANDDGVLGPAPDGTSDPVPRCGACGHDHVDDDSNPGLYMGSRTEMEVERARLASEEVWRDAWAYLDEEAARHRARTLTEIVKRENPEARPFVVERAPLGSWERVEQ